MACTVVRVKGSPYIATKNGDGWNVTHEQTHVLVAWVRGGQTDARNEIRNVTAQAKLVTGATYGKGQS